MTKKSYAKVNIFLKIVGKRDSYHLLASRFALVHKLYDTITFSEEKCNSFTLEGEFGCDTNKNTIYKAYLKLCEISPIVQFYFKSHKVIVDKKIPEFAGLGGGSSNCASFILMVNEVCNLNKTKDELAALGLQIGADVPFFIYEYNSANVSGIGEIVEEFIEEKLNITVVTPKVMCDTGSVFKVFKEKFYREASIVEEEKLFNMKSIDIYNTYDINYANDLYESALYLEPNL